MAVEEAEGDWGSARKRGPAQSGDGQGHTLPPSSASAASEHGDIHRQGLLLHFPVPNPVQSSLLPAFNQGLYGEGDSENHSFSLAKLT